MLARPRKRQKLIQRPRKIHQILTTWPYLTWKDARRLIGLLLVKQALTSIVKAQTVKKKEKNTLSLSLTQNTVAKKKYAKAMKS